MSSSYIAEIGDGIVAGITASGLAKPVRTYSPEVKLEDLGKTPEVYVRSSILEAPRADVPHSRLKRFIDIPFDLLLIARVSGCDTADVDNVIALYEQIDQYLYQNVRQIQTTESMTGTAMWVASSIDTLFSQDNLRQQQVAQVNGQVVYRYQL